MAGRWGWQRLGAAEMMQVHFLAVAVGKPVRCNDTYRVRDSAASSGVPQFLLIELYDVCWWRHGGGGGEGGCDCFQGPLVAGVGARHTGDELNWSQ